MALFSDESDNEMYEAGVFDSAATTESDERRVYSRINYESEFSDSEFTFRFRLNKTSVNELLVKILPNLRVTSSRNYGVSPLHQLLLTLRFYALGTMLVSVADFIGVSKATASRIVSDVSRAIAGLYPEYVKVLENTQRAFHAIAGFPKVLGAIDCTHIPLQSPSSNIGEEYRNRKGIFSMNVQGVCNADLLFMNVVARWPGSAHDATIFNNSIFKRARSQSVEWLETALLIEFFELKVHRMCNGQRTAFKPIASLADGRSWDEADYKPETVERTNDWSKDCYSSGDSTFHTSGSDNNISYHSEYGTGKYTGFGNQTSQSTPMSPMHSGNETFDSTIASLATGWSVFASSVSKAARTATESAVRYGGIATQKVSEMASTVTEKVNTRGGWSTLGGTTDQRRSSNASANYQGSGYGAMKSSTSEPYSQWNESVPHKESVTTRNVDGQDLSRVGVAPGNNGGAAPQEENWDWLNQ